MKMETSAVDVNERQRDREQPSDTDTEMNAINKLTRTNRLKFPFDNLNAENGHMSLSSSSSIALCAITRIHYIFPDPKIFWYSVPQMINMRRSRLCSGCHTVVVIVAHTHDAHESSRTYYDIFIMHEHERRLAIWESRRRRLSECRLRSTRVWSCHLRGVCCMQIVFCRPISFAIWLVSKWTYINIYKIIVYNAIEMWMEIIQIKCAFGIRAKWLCV